MHKVQIACCYLKPVGLRWPSDSLYDLEYVQDKI